MGRLIRMDFYRLIQSKVFWISLLIFSGLQFILNFFNGMFANYNADEMMDSINYAKTVYFTQRDRWYEIAQRGMRMDYSWSRSAQKYEQLYYNLTSW